jgi:hypothetical protein
MADPQPGEVKQRQALGPALDWTDEEIERLAQVGPDDARLAADWWRRNAPGRYKRLLDAAPVLRRVEG